MFNRLFPFAFFALMFGTIAAGYALSTETQYMYREGVANGNNESLCSLKFYGR